MKKQEYNVKAGETKIVFDFIFDSEDSSVIINLNEPGAKGYIYGIFVGDNQDKININHKIIHNAPNTESDILVKGVLDDSAKANYQSLIRIEKGMDGASGKQKEDTLLLSKKAKITAIPNLEIEHNDVVCSHGVTTTNIDKEKLFFMNSRGVSKAEAIQELVQAHFSPVIDKIQDKEIRKEIIDKIKSKYE